VLFSDGVRLWRSGFGPPSAGRKTALHRMLKGTGAGGWTNLFGGLEKAFGMKSALPGSRYSEPPDEVFLLSDGEPTAGDIVAPDRILAVVRELNRYAQVRLHTVFMGGGHSSFMTSFTRCSASGRSELKSILDVPCLRR